ncbi:MAG: carboxypeptidase-like regulatory domain-containing protein, partial [Chitinophagaceae bacterium]
MKLTVLLVLAACLQSGARGFAQITISETNVPIKKVFDQIEKQSGYLFWYTNAVLQKTHPVTIHVKNTDLQKALDICLAGQPLVYSIVEKVVVIKEDAQKAEKLFSSPVPAPATIQGVVTDEAGKPLEGASIQIKGTTRGTYSDAAGNFELKDVEETATLLIQFTGYGAREIRLSGETYIICKLSIDVRDLADVNIQVSTGYQVIPKERATGSFTFIDNKLFNRRVSMNVLDRLDGVASGLLFNRNKKAAANEAQITIRGRSTIFGQPDPLIVIDNFPYDGDINNINPNDVESITLLKDAAAASIWGVRSGNGVIVITTKSGRINQKPKVSFNSNVTVSSSPDMYYRPVINTSDYIDMELFLYSKGYFNARITNPYQSISPTVEILARRKAGLISSADSASQIDKLRGYDVRRDLSRFF